MPGLIPCQIRWDNGKLRAAAVDERECACLPGSSPSARPRTHEAWLRAEPGFGFLRSGVDRGRGARLLRFIGLPCPEQLATSAAIRCPRSLHGAATGPRRLAHGARETPRCPQDPHGSQLRHRRASAATCPLPQPLPADLAWRSWPREGDDAWQSNLDYISEHALRHRSGEAKTAARSGPSAQSDAHALRKRADSATATRGSRPGRSAPHPRCRVRARDPAAP